MNVNAKYIQHVQVDIDNEECNNIAIKVLKKIFNDEEEYDWISNNLEDLFIKEKNKLYYSAEYIGGSHSYFEKMFIKELSEEELYLFNIFKRILNYREKTNA